MTDESNFLYLVFFVLMGFLVVVDSCTSTSKNLNDRVEQLENKVESLTEELTNVVKVQTSILVEQKGQIERENTLLKSIQRRWGIEDE